MIRRILSAAILIGLATGASASQYVIRQSTFLSKATNFTVDADGNLTISGSFSASGNDAGSSATYTDIDAGASGTAGSLDVFPTTAAKGKLRVVAADSAGDTASTITNASQTTTATWTIPDTNGNAGFVMTAAAQTIGGVKTFSAIPVFPTTGVTLGTTTISEAEAGVLDSLTATKVEIQNVADVSAQLQAITEAGAVTVDGTKRRATLSGGAYAITLAVPDAAAIGAVLVIEYAGGDTDAVTMALTNVIGESGGTTATFNADGEGMVLIGTALGWVVLSEFGGVTLA